MKITTKTMKTLVLVLLMSALWAPALCGAETIPVQPAIHEAFLGLVTDAALLPTEKFDWGTLKWLCNATLVPGAMQTVGIAEILPGKRNPVHFHPNCEEVLYVLSGQGRHSFDDRAVDLKAGMTIRIPAGVKHNMFNTGTEPLTALITFSSGDRKTVFLEEKPAN